MATLAHPASRFRLSADAIRDVCSRPAVLLALGEDVPTGAVRSAADRQRAVCDGVARALELALANERGRAPDRFAVPLLDEAERRMWEPLPLGLAQLLQRTGPDGLFAYWVVSGATRREAWRADTQRRRAERVDQLPADVAAAPERDPVDLMRFRVDVERTVDATARRTGLPDDMAYGVVVSEVSYAEASRRTGRSPNGLWMAMARLRPEWRGLAERGRAAGLGGGILVRVTDRTDAAVRRAIRWRLVGGCAAAALLGCSLGAVALAAYLQGSSAIVRPPVESTFEAQPAGGEGPYGPIGRILALQAASRLLGDDGRPGRTQTPAPVVHAAPRAESTSAGSSGNGDVGHVPGGAATAGGSCGLGSAALACR